MRVVLDGELDRLRLVLVAQLGHERQREVDPRGDAGAGQAVAVDDDALVEIHFRQALAEDDPANPAYRTIQSLKRVRGSYTSDAIDDEIARVERDAFGTTESMPWLAIVHDLRRADELIRSSKDADKEKGDKLLRETLRRLRY